MLSGLKPVVSADTGSNYSNAEKSNPDRTVICKVNVLCFYQANRLLSS